MKSRLHRQSLKWGKSPGSLVYLGDRHTDTPHLQWVEVRPDALEAYSRRKADISVPFPAEGYRWISLIGLHHTDMVASVGEWFHMHPLSLEDSLNMAHLPKVESVGDYLHCILKRPVFLDDHAAVEVEQVSIVLRENGVLLFQERPSDFFDLVLLRMLPEKSRLRHQGSDYLTYVLVDMVVDHYFAWLERLVPAFTLLEEDIHKRPGTDRLTRIHELKKELSQIKQLLMPTREVVANLQRRDHHLIQEETKIFLGDVLDHVEALLHHTEALHADLNGLESLLFNLISLKTNESVRLLTVISTLFIPMTFLVGVYGMNFHYMPELAWSWGYPGIMGVNLALGLGLFWWFKRRKWL
jgi:magnesium transporter